MQNSINLSIVLNKLVSILFTGTLLAFSLSVHAEKKLKLACIQYTGPESYLNNLGKYPISNLIQCGLKVNAAYRVKSDNDFIVLTALQLFAEIKDLKVMQELLENGADPNIISDEKSGYPPLSIAVFKQNYAMAFLLAGHGANLKYIEPISKLNYYMQLAFDKNQDADVDHFLDLLEKEKVNINYQEQKGLTALHLAAAHNNIAYVLKLMARHANPCIKDVLGRSPIDFSIQRGHIEMQKILNQYEVAECSNSPNKNSQEKTEKVD